MQSFLNNATDGTIYFSLGSIAKSALLPIKMRKDILQTFSKLKMKVLWKWEETDLAGKPDNVFISKWFPQSDILVHPNVRLFITHGGLLSSIEAVFHDVPILGLPVFGDQHVNMARAVQKGYGQSLGLKHLTENSFTLAINQMIGTDR